MTLHVLPGPDGPNPWPPGPPHPCDPIAWFRSGTNQPGEIQGLASVGCDVGVCATRLSALGEAALVQLRDEPEQPWVFVDSGAFTEKRTGKEPNWERVLGLYERLAPVLRSRLYLVVPDKVGDQDATIERLQRYAPRLLQLRNDYLVRLLVPMQKGPHSWRTYVGAVLDTLGDGDWIPALPCKAAAFTAADVEQFMLDVHPRQVHLLGKGRRSRDVRAYLDALLAWRPEPVHLYCPACQVTMDSCWLAANAQRARYLGRWTGARDKARLELGPAATKPEVDRLAARYAWPTMVTLPELQALETERARTGATDCLGVYASCRPTYSVGRSMEVSLP